MSPVELVLLAELHADGSSMVLARLRQVPEWAAALDALDQVQRELRDLSIDQPPASS